MSITIRRAALPDLPVINEIYNHYVLCSTCTYQVQPSTLAERRQWFDQHGPKHPIVVGVEDGIIRAWASLSRFHPREAYARSVESSIYVHHEHHRRGLGRALMLELLAQARQLEYRTVLAGISADQRASIKLHASLGFQQCAHFREVGHKFDQWLDVIWMQLMLQDTLGPSETPLEGAPAR